MPRIARDWMWLYADGPRCAVAMRWGLGEVSSSYMGQLLVITETENPGRGGKAISWGLGGGLAHSDAMRSSSSAHSASVPPGTGSAPPFSRFSSISASRV